MEESWLPLELGWPRSTLSKFGFKTMRNKGFNLEARHLGENSAVDQALLSLDAFTPLVRSLRLDGVYAVRGLKRHYIDAAQLHVCLPSVPEHLS